MWRLASMRRPPENLSEAIRAGGGERPNHLMVRIVITEEAFKAIKATLLVGSVALSTEVTKGRRQIWLERDWVDKLAAMCRPSESLCEVILRLVEMEAGQRGE